MNKKRAKFFISIALIIAIILIVMFSIPFIRFIENPDKLRSFFESYGPLAPLMFIILSMIQIFVPFIPGEPFELFAGYSFGFVEGTILCLVAGCIASIIIILFVKKYGHKIVDLFFNSKDYRKLNFLKTKKAFIIYSLFFIMPGTPKDLLCYIGGLTNYDLIPLLIVTTIGRIPGIVSSTFPASALGERKTLLAIIVYVITIIISLICLMIYKNKVNKTPNDD